MYKRLHRVVLLMCMMVCFPLTCMNGLYDLALREVMIRNDYYDTHRTLAVLCKTYNKIIEEEYRPDKKRIERLMHARGTPICAEKVFWNKNFSQCAWITVKPMQCAVCYENLQLLKLMLLHLVGAEAQGIEIKNTQWKGYLGPAITETSRPFFNKKGEACFYGYAYVDGDHLDKTVFEYSLDSSGQSKAQKCIIKLSENDFVSFYDLFNLPILLKAFLQSKNVMVYQDDDNDTVKAYSINGVSIPEDYTCFKKHLSLGFIKNGEYNSLMYKLKDAINKRYNEQQLEKMIALMQ